MKSYSILFLLSCWISSISTIFADTQSNIVNKEVSQIVDATTSIVKYSVEVKATHVKGEYIFVFQNGWADHLAFVSVTSKGVKLNVHPPVSQENYTMISVDISESSPTLKLKAVFTDILNPYPTSITQMENQYVILEGNHYFLSPYETLTQKTVYKLASSNIESFTKLSPYSTRGSNLHFGPFKEIAPFSYSKATIHFLNNYPFAKFSTLTKEVEVSHWGNIAIEEIYELKHAGASLKGGFSRFDYQMKRGAQQQTSFRNLVAELPAQANNIYYRDQIGNISTSDIRTTSDGIIELDIQTRFPIFGGWQTQFYIGYSVPTELSLFRDSEEDKFLLKVDFFTIFRNVWIEDLEVKIILPEGCTEIEATVPYAIEKHESVRYTYLDSKLNGGRTVIKLNAKNIVEEHDEQILISYKFQKQRMLVEPFMLVGAFFFLFCFCIIIGRTTSVNSSSTKSTSTDVRAN